MKIQMRIHRFTETTSLRRRRVRPAPLVCPPVFPVAIEREQVRKRAEGPETP